MKQRILAGTLSIILALSPVVQINAFGSTGLYNDNSVDVITDTDADSVEVFDEEETVTDSFDNAAMAEGEMTSTEETATEEPAVEENVSDEEPETSEEESSYEEQMTTQEEVSLEEVITSADEDASADVLMFENIDLNAIDSYSESIVIETQPQKITELTIGESVKLQVKAVSENNRSLKYQWYQTQTSYRPANTAVKIADATKPQLTVTPKNRGTQYFFCIITDGTDVILTDCAAVLTTNKGCKICSSHLDFSKEEVIDKLEEDGYKWDGFTKTLTLKNIDFRSPFMGDNALTIYTGTTVVVEGTNYISDRDGYFLIRPSEDKEGVITTFKGPGKLVTDYFDAMGASDEYEYRFTDDITVEAVELGSYREANFVLDNATYFAKDYRAVKGLTLKNGAYLEAANGLKAIGDVKIGSGCKLVCGGGVVTYGGLTIEDNAVAQMESLFLTDSSVDDRECILTIYGTLHIYPRDEKTKPIRINSYAKNPYVTGEDVSVVTPKGAEFGLFQFKSNAQYYGVMYNGFEYFGELIIGQSNMPASRKIAGSKTITGKAVYGDLLYAGKVEPKNATVSYEWQYSDKKDGVWETISHAVSSTYKVEAKYADKYLRVITRGYGNYTGEIVSDIVGPVAPGNDGFLSALWILNGDKEELIAKNFDGESFSYNHSSELTGTDMVRYYTEPVDENATIVIKNTSNGFSFEGKVADVPLIEGTNDIEIEVTNGLKKNTYYIYHNVTKKTALSFTLYSEYVSLKATLKFETGLYEMDVIPGERMTYKGIKPGTEITITSNPEAGTFPTKYNGISGVPDKTKEGYPLSFILNQDTAVTYLEEDSMAYVPQGLSANWVLDENDLQITIEADANAEAFEAENVNYYVEMYDEKGEIISEITFSYPVEGDFLSRILNDTGLDNSKRYTFRAINSNYNPKQPIEEQTAYFTLEPRKPVALSLDSDYIVLKSTGMAEVPVHFNGYEGSRVFLESGYDTNVVSQSGTKLVTDAEGNMVLQIKPIMQGTTYLTLRGDDYRDKNGDMHYVLASIRVDVCDTEEAASLSLGEKKGSLNIYEDSVIMLPVYRMECGHDIECAEFSNASLNEKFTISVVNDRTLKIEPIIPVDDGNIDYEKWLAESGRTGTFKSKIKVKYNGEFVSESDEEYTLTLTAKKPKIKISTIEFSSFYTEQTKNVPVTVTGKKIQKIQVDTAKNAQGMIACPEYFYVNEKENTVKFDGSIIPSDVFTSSIYLKIWPEGYRIPLQAKAKVKVSYKKPVVKFENSTIALKSSAPTKETDTYLKLVSGDKKQSFKDVQVESVRCFSYTEFMQLNRKDRNAYIARDFFTIKSFDNNTGDLVLSYSDKPTKGKTSFYANIRNGKEPVLLTASVKTGLNTYLKVSKSTITMDARFGSYPDYDDVYLDLTTNVKGYKFSAFSADYTLHIYKVGDKSKKDYESNFWFICKPETKQLYIRRYGALEKGTYKAYYYARNIEKPAVITIKVIEGKAPSVKASAKEITINRLEKYPDGGKAVYFSLPKKIDGYNVNNVKISGPDDSSLFVSRSWNKNRNAYELRIDSNSTTKKGTHYVEVSLRDYAYNVSGPVTLKVNVIDKAPSVKISERSLTLNQDINEYSSAKAKLNVPYEKYEFSDEECIVSYVKDTKGRDAKDKLNVSVSDGFLRVSCNSKTEYGATYKVKVAYQFAYGITKYDTISVKIAKKDATVLSALKPNGSIDLTRPDNGLIRMEIVGDKYDSVVFVGEDAPYYEWELYAKNGKNAVGVAEGATNDSGLVARGSSLKTGVDNNNRSAYWFVNNVAYGIGLKINQASDAWKNEQIAAHYTYTLKAKLIIPSTGTETNLAPVNFKLKSGTVKYTLNEKSIVLNKADDKGRALISITDNNAADLKVSKIAHVEIVGNNKIPVSNALEIVPLYHYNNKITYAIYWKDNKDSNIQSGDIAINVYLEGNNPKWRQPNTSLNLKVNVK